jgi:CxxC motif-containing protein (DUF1111 family)
LFSSRPYYYIKYKNVLANTIIFLFSISTSPCFSSEKNDAGIILPTTQFSTAEKYEALPAGAATYQKNINANAFSHASNNMSFERELDFKLGNALFKKIWVSSPSSTQASDGLGPLFNARACQRCHIKDGRGPPPPQMIKTIVFQC